MPSEFHLFANNKKTKRRDPIQAALPMLQQNRIKNIKYTPTQIDEQHQKQETTANCRRFRLSIRTLSLKSAQKCTEVPIVNGKEDKVASNSATVGLIMHKKKNSLGTQKPTALMINMLTTLEKTE